MLAKAQREARSRGCGASGSRLSARAAAVSPPAAITGREAFDGEVRVCRCAAAVAAHPLHVLGFKIKPREADGERANNICITIYLPKNLLNLYIPDPALSLVSAGPSHFYLHSSLLARTSAPSPKPAH